MTDKERIERLEERVTTLEWIIGTFIGFADGQEVVYKSLRDVIRKKV